jgi:hypothetical protein
MHSVILDRLYLVQGIDTLHLCEKFRWFLPHESIQYFPSCDDFGPMNMASVIGFAKQMHRELSDNPGCRFFYRADAEKRALTNAIFLLGAYLVLMVDLASDEVADDCWRGLERGVNGWVGRPRMHKFLWRMIDVDEYAQYLSLINGDLHEIVPGKFIAFKGPQDLGSTATTSMASAASLRCTTPAFCMIWA